ncbi:uncharacterized protein LOC132757773 [Ruditapes philippinarum]|uniref:uncharacterized protein LOC132757773 n=1 Tax=Ruditapes philippinarum TaxID=129788 RepID=UPI00295B8B51|nr:uncharacterized protein LOC132757773 [Ruditapes philippinarum]
MAEFLSALNGFYENVGSGNDNETEVTECTSKISTQAFHFWITIPSVLMILLLACTFSRKNKFLTCLWGRPGAVFPMDILGKSHRFSYAAAWGSIAFLAADLVFGSTVIVKLEGPSYVTVFNAVLSMIVIGVDYFPMFAALSLESAVGYLVGTAYAWLLLAIQIFREVECDLTYQTRLILILRDVPNLLCLAYLSFSLPVRLIQSVRQKSIRFLSASEMVSILNMEKDQDLSPEAFHIKHLLRPVPPPPPPPTTLGGKVMQIVKNFIGDWIYHNKHKFRYSSRILSVMLIGFMLIYKATLEVMTLAIGIFAFIERGFILTLDAIGWDSEIDEEAYVKQIRDYTKFMYFLLINVRICFIVALSLACVAGILGILHMLSSYRTNLFDLYKGDNTHIPHRSTRSNTSLLVGSMRYAGYQVAYIGWGLVLHFIILLIIAVALCTIITMIIYGYYQWMLTVLFNAWPAAVMTIIIMLTQTLLSKFAFLQGRGEFLAIDNRRVLFSFTFFMFFYNIFVGFLSCLLRIVKSIVIGAIFLPRLDNSALPRRFQMFDPGFANYCGFIHVECAHTHPVLVMFLRILLHINEDKNSSESSDSNHTAVEMNGKGKSSKAKPVNARARARWFLIYTLHNNPTIRVYRKSYMQYMRMLQERLARYYNLDKATMGNLAKSINTVYTDNGKADINDISVEVNGGFNAAQANWNALFGMNKLMRQIQKDMAEGTGAFAKDFDEQNNQTESDENKGSGNNVIVKNPKGMWQKAAFSSLSTKNITPSTNYLTMAELFEILSYIYTHRGQEGNETETGECITKVPRSTFHLYLMIPSILTTLLLAWTHPRKNKWLNILHGRPGVIYPMNILGKSHRFLYGAAWGSIAYLAAELVFENDIVQLEGPPYVTVFKTVLAMIVIGIDYFPMFSAFAFESYVGYAIGTAYAWMFLIVQIYRDTECDLAGRFRFALLFGDIPNLLCLGYLAISLPIQVLRILRKKSIRLFSSSEKVSVLRRSISVKNSPEAKHVKQLLKPPLPPIEDEPILLKDKICLKVKTFVSDWIYKREPGFRYSARMISVMVIGLMVIYKITVQITAAIIVVFNASDVLLQQKLDQIEMSSQVNQSKDISAEREGINITLSLISDIRICFICSICAAYIGNIFTILHMMSSYRTNLFDLYKRIHNNIPPRSTLENKNLLVGSIKFAGYQVAYITWGFVIHLIILIILSLILCIIIWMIRYGYYDWILSLLSGIWPTVLMTIFLIVLVIRFCDYFFS